jgi:hypothetical protein
MTRSRRLQPFELSACHDVFNKRRLFAENSFQLLARCRRHLLGQKSRLYTRGIGVEPPNPAGGEHGAKSNFSRCYSRGGSVRRTYRLMQNGKGFGF